MQILTFHILEVVFTLSSMFSFMVNSLPFVLTCMFLFVSGDGNEEHAVFGLRVCTEWRNIWFVLALIQSCTPTSLSLSVSFSHGF